MSAKQVWRADGFSWLPGEFDELLAAFGIDGEVANVFTTVGDTRFYVKLRRIRRSTCYTRPQRWRWVGFSYRKQEFDNLCFLCDAGVPALQPAAAAVTYRGVFLHQELLATVALEGLRDLREVLGEVSEERANVLCARAGATLAQMHDLGFVHRDFFPRNLLVRETAGAPELFVLDCRKGGTNWAPRRNFAYDLGCFDMWSGVLFPVSARHSFFATYVRDRGLREREGRALLAKAAKRRQALVRHRTHTKRSVHKQFQQWAPAVSLPPVSWDDLAAAPLPDPSGSHG